MDKAKLDVESYKLEHKVQIPTTDKTWLNSIVAFSNSAGGELVIGIENQTLESRV